MTLIRRMHSLRRGEGRVGWLSNGKYMHWLQDELGLESRWGWKLCPWAALLSETGQGWAWEGGEVPMKLSLRDHASVFAICSMGGLLPEKKKRKKWRKETEIYREKPPPPPPPPVWTSRYFQRQDAKYIKWHSQNPPPAPENPKGEMLFLTQISRYFPTLTTRCKACGDEGCKGRSNFPRGFAGALGRAECHASERWGSLAHWTVPVEGTGVGADASSPRLPEGRVGMGRSWY